MKIINKTKWKTAHLRAIAARVLREEIEDPEKRRRIRLTIRPSRKRCSGLAAIGGCWTIVRLPNPAPGKVYEPSLQVKFAYMCAHEFAHNRGMKDERQMRAGARYGWRDSDRWKTIFGWAAAMPLEAQGPKRVDRPTADSKLLATEKLLQTWARKLKLAQTKIKKYKTRLAYYDRRMKLAAQTVSPKEQEGTDG